MSLLSLFVVIIYAQAKTVSTLAIANDSQDKIQIADNNTLVNTTTPDSDDDKKLVKKTASVRSASAGASRGSFSATAYCFTGKMANGQGVRRGVIAADTRVLRMGSRVYINAGPWSGVYTVADRGGAIKGKKIDIWVPGCSEARKFGRRSVQIFDVQ